MLYTKLTKKAMKIAFEAHKNQSDKNGIPYIYHPVHLAEQFDTEALICTALLHDVLEDSNLKAEDLIKEGFSKDITDALNLLTRSENMDYFDYINSLKSNNIAREVKKKDLIHNMDTTRLDFIDEHSLKRVEKYKKALEILEKFN